MNGMPEGWRRLPLGDVLDFKRGYDLPAKVRAPGLVPVVSSSGPSGFHSESKAIGPGVVTGRYGTLGEVFFVQGPYWPLNTTLYVKDFKGNDPKFISYFLRQQRLGDQSSAAAVPGLNRNFLHQLEVLLPPLEIQIALILSHYDDLIENNARRIEILEEMAQAIYREWFVEFRYPGHEDAALVDSELGPIPEGWGVTTVDAAFEISGGGTPSKTVTEYWEDGDIDWYTPTDLTAARSMFMSESKSKITKLGLAKSSAKLFPAGSVMMTSRATIGVVSISETEASTNQGFITCIPNDRYSAYFIVQWLRSSADVIDSLASGATFKEINKKNFREIKIVAPSEIALKRFQELVAPICDSIAVLLKSNRNLRETRDLLLPRLISGEIDVSGLDIELAGSSV